MKVKLVTYTQEPEKTVVSAGRLCYSPTGVEEISKKLTDEKVNEFIKKAIKSKHLSLFEHANFTFAIEGISRACSHQLVRHRLASYSQQSQRYVKFTDRFEYIIPETIKESKALKEKFDEVVKITKKFYDEMLERNIPAEDARYILPNASETKIVVTMNARELLHFFNLRMCNRAQWEIKNLAKLMLDEVVKVVPNIFKFAGPNCAIDFCREEHPCGKPYKKC